MSRRSAAPAARRHRAHEQTFVYAVRVGYRGKTTEQQRARELRAEAWTLAEIAEELGVSRSSASVWVRDVVFEPKPRQRPIFRNPSSLHLKKLAEIDADERVGQASSSASSPTTPSSPPELALYAGEGAKADGIGEVREHRPGDDRVLLSLAPSLLRRRRIAAAGPRVPARGPRSRCGRGATGPRSPACPRAAVPQAVPCRRPTRRSVPRSTSHGCCYVRVLCSRTHRQIMGLVRALLS